MYKLAKGTYELHELLKDVNNYAIGAHEDERKLRYAIQFVFRYFKFDLGLEPESKKYNIRNNRDYEALTSDEKEEYEIENDQNSIIRNNNYTKIKNIEDKIINDIHSNHDESPSTVLMKYIGFEGVDVIGTDLDNSRYGSVIYDIKKDSIIK